MFCGKMYHELWLFVNFFVKGLERFTGVLAVGAVVAGAAAEGFTDWRDVVAHQHLFQVKDCQYTE